MLWSLIKGAIVIACEVAGVGVIPTVIWVADALNAVIAADDAQAEVKNAVKDWAIRGEASPHAFSAAKAASHVPLITPEIARAHALFRLGRALYALGETKEADEHFAEASRLHPDSWNIWRQAGDMRLEGKPNPDFWARVDQLGPRRYYQKIDMAGMP